MFALINKKNPIVHAIYKMVLVPSFVAVSIGFFAIDVFADVPTFINYQSRLRDSASDPITTATTIILSVL